MKGTNIEELTKLDILYVCLLRVSFEDLKGEIISMSNK